MKDISGYTFVITLVIASGCCPLGTSIQANTQPITVRIISMSTEEVESDATVVMGPVEPSRVSGEFREPSDDEYLETLRDQSQVTDSMGIATVSVDSISVCTCLPCDFAQDTVSGQDFIVLIEKGTESEIIHFTASVSEQVSGEIFTLEVLEIGDATPTN